MTKMQKKKSKRSRLRSIRFKFITTLIFLSIVPVLILGVVNYRNSYSILEKNFLESTQQVVDQVNVGIDNYFRGIEGLVNALAYDVEVQRISERPEDEASALERFENFNKGNADISNIYLGQASKKMTIFPKADLGADYDPTNREWYRRAVENRGICIYHNKYRNNGNSSQ